MSDSHNISKKIEAVLFWKAEPLSIKKLSSIISVSEADVREGLDLLERDLAGRGLILVRMDEDVMLGTSREFSALIEEITKEELSRDIGKAGLETLSIILYQGPISRADIDYIRGVNSQFILRNLLIRGLIERTDNPVDSRSFLYKPSLELLAHMGLSKLEDLPDYKKVRHDIETFKSGTITENNNIENSEAFPDHKTGENHE